MEEWIKEGDGGEYDQSMQYTCLKMSQWMKLTILYI
jgi:hypothetical protein